MRFTFQPVSIETGGLDEDGCLVFADNRLVAVLVRLSDLHGDEAGSWFFEHGFGRLDGPAHPLFTDLEGVQDWIMRRFAEAWRI